MKQADLDRDPAGAGFTTSSEKLGFLNFADSYPELTIRADNPSPYITVPWAEA